MWRVGWSSFDETQSLRIRCGLKPMRDYVVVVDGGLFQIRYSWKIAGAKLKIGRFVHVVHLKHVE